MTRLWVMSFFEVRLRTCLKNHSCNLHVPFCSIFHSNSVVVATECDWRQVQKLMIYLIEYPDLAYALTKAWDVRSRSL
mgnify:FL=1